MPAAAQASYYAHILRERAYERKVIQTGTRMVQMGYEAAGNGLTDLRGAVAVECAAVTEADTKQAIQQPPADASPETLSPLKPPLTCESDKVTEVTPLRLARERLIDLAHGGHQPRGGQHPVVVLRHGLSVPRGLLGCVSLAQHVPVVDQDVGPEAPRCARSPHSTRRRWRPCRWPPRRNRPG